MPTPRATGKQAAGHPAEWQVGSAARLPITTRKHTARPAYSTGRTEACAGGPGFSAPR